MIISKLLTLERREKKAMKLETYQKVLPESTLKNKMRLHTSSHYLSMPDSLEIATFTG
jgi:hypothetical protein